MAEEEEEEEREGGLIVYFVHGMMPRGPSITKPESLNQTSTHILLILLMRCVIKGVLCCSSAPELGLTFSHATSSLSLTVSRPDV